MAKLRVDAMDNLLYSMQQIESIPKSDLAEIIARQAEIVSAAVRAEAQKLGVGYDKKHNNARDTTPENSLPGQKKTYSTGETARSVAIRAAKPDKKGIMAGQVYFRGSRPNGRHGRKTNAEVAFLNEYGSRNINARNFIWRALAQVESAVIGAARDGIDSILKKQNL